MGSTIRIIQVKRGLIVVEKGGRGRYGAGAGTRNITVETNTNIGIFSNCK
jgi:hypothetical protein